MTRLSVPDMSCDHCKASVTAALSALPDSGTITVDLDRGEVTVGGPSHPDPLIAALASIGFPARLIAQT